MCLVRQLPRCSACFCSPLLVHEEAFDFLCQLLGLMSGASEGVMVLLILSPARVARWSHVRQELESSCKPVLRKSSRSSSPKGKTLLSLLSRKDLCLSSTPNLQTERTRQTRPISRKTLRNLRAELTRQTYKQNERQQTQLFSRKTTGNQRTEPTCQKKV